MAGNLQITHTNSGRALVPTEEPLAQMLTEPHMAHEATGLLGDVSRRSDHDNALGVPALTLRKCYRSSAKEWPTASAAFP